MKVILLHDVPKVGKKFEIKDISDGFAQNSLIPKNLAIVATTGAKKRVELLRKQNESQQKINTDLLLKNFSSVDGVTIEIEARANEKGHLFSSIHKTEILKALLDQKRVDVPESALVLDKPIKEIGKHVISVEVSDKKGAFNLDIKKLNMNNEKLT